MRILVLATLGLALSVVACMGDVAPTPVDVPPSAPALSYVHDIKPILDRRCVVCHNAPCQLQLGSYEVLDRGATKAAVYATRFRAQDPTRLFMDHQG